MPKRLGINDGGDAARVGGKNLQLFYACRLSDVAYRQKPPCWLCYNEPMRSKVEIKGIREGLLATLGEGEWPELRDTLFEQIRQKADFFRGARLALDVGSLPLHAADLSQLRAVLSDQQITLWAVVSNSPLTEQTARTLGLFTQLTRPRPEPAATKLPETTYYDGEQALLVRRTLRSGYKIEFPGHVTVIGDVNPGAEIVAGGDVVVWGRLRGVVHAGAEGKEDALVCALDLSPTQLRIAGRIATTPQRRGKTNPEVARLREGQVVADVWEAGKTK
jgi:septum site-determining protein MinC